MDKIKLEYFRSELLQERKKQIKSLANREQNKDESIELLERELSSYDNHPADVGTEVYMMEQEIGYKEKIKENIKAIDFSLEKIKNGLYGVCDNCKMRIKTKRLKLIPYTNTCLECSDDPGISNEENPNNKKIYESLNYQSFNLRTTKDNVEYDGEDTYQDIMQDNIVSKDPSFSTGDNLGIMDEELDIVEDVEKISEEYYKNTLE